MGNLAIAFVIGSVTCLALYLPGFLRLTEAIVPGVIVLGVAYLILARRAFRQLEGIFAESAQVLHGVPPKFDLAVATLRKAYKLAPMQFGIRSQVNTQIGVILFLQKDFTKALPYLKKSLMFGHWMGGAMLAVIHYKKRDHVEMRRVLEIVTKRAKKQGLAWNLYAYLLMQIGEKEAAQRVLTEGVKYAKDDPRVQESLLAVQNGKKIKMRNYKEQWYQFHLERPPVEHQQAAPGGRMSKMARRGRW